MAIWVKFTHPVHFSSLIPEMSTFTLAISCLTTSNLPWFMDLTFQVPMQYCSLKHQTLLPSPVTSTAGCSFCFGSLSSFFLDLFLHWSPVAYGHLPTWGDHLSVSYLFAFSYCSWGSQGKNTEVVCHSLLQLTTFCQNSPPWPHDIFNWVIWFLFFFDVGLYEFFVYFGYNHLSAISFTNIISHSVDGLEFCW